MKQIIRLTESQLHNLIKKCINEVKLQPIEDEPVKGNPIDDKHSSVYRARPYQFSSQPLITTGQRGEWTNSPRGNHSAQDTTLELSEITSVQENFAKADHINLSDEQWSDYIKYLRKHIPYERINVGTDDNPQYKVIPNRTVGKKEDGGMMSETEFNKNVNRVACRLYDRYEVRPTWRILHKESKPILSFIEYNFDGKWYILTSASRKGAEGCPDVESPFN